MGYIKKIIFKTLSVRGVGKINNAQNVFIKYMWSLFVFVMTFLLFYASGKLIEEFFKYDLVLQVNIKRNDKSTKFPTFTFCHNSPFGPSSSYYWSNNKTISPTGFNKKIRQRIKESDSNFQYFFYDTRRTYYQQLTLEEATKVSWTEDETFMLCSVKFDKYDHLGRGKDCNLIVKTISLPQYFNCFSVSIQINETAKQLTLLLRTTSIANITNSPFLKGFVNDVFDELSGLRGYIHNYDTYPDIENKGINFEMGKVIEINYQPVKSYKKNTPYSHCTDIHQSKLQDLNSNFTFSQKECYLQILGKEIVEKCGCYYTDALRAGIPNNSVPYCGNILNIDQMTFIKRLTCVKRIKLNYTKKKNSIYNNECAPNCHKTSYKYTTSVTRWLPKNWQISSVFDMHHCITKLDDSKCKKTIENYASIDDLYKYKAVFSDLNFEKKRNFVMIVIRRQSFDTIEEKEKLTLELYNLISRFGGLCSLCLGVTCAFLCEIIEILYLIYKERQKLKNNSQTDLINDNNNSNDAQKTYADNSTSPLSDEDNRKSKDIELVFKLIDREYPVFLSSL